MNESPECWIGKLWDIKNDDRIGGRDDVEPEDKNFSELKGVIGVQ